MFFFVASLNHHFGDEVVNIEENAKGLGDDAGEEKTKIKDEDHCHDDGLDEHVFIVCTILTRAVLHVVVLHHFLEVVDVVVLHPFDAEVVEVLVVRDISEIPFP